MPRRRRGALLDVTLGTAAAALALLGLARLVPAAAESSPAEDARDPPAPLAAAEPALRAHAERVADYTLRATLDPLAHRVHGEGTIVWRNASQAPVSELWLHLYLNAFEHEGTLFLREPVRSGRGTQLPTAWGRIDVRRLVARELGDVDLWSGAERTTPGDPADRTDIRVPLPAPVAAGATLTLDVAWDAELPSLVERTGYADGFHMVGQWFPKLARLEPDGRWAHFPFHHLAEFYADYGRYDVTVDVPEGFVVGATGAAVSEERSAGRVRTRFVQDDVHDFAFTAWNGFRERTREASGVRVRCLYPAGYESVAARELAAAAFGLRWFGEAFGRYPYATLTIVHPPIDAGEAGGMEYPTLITTGGAWWTPRGLHAIEAVTLHELGHEWFYGLVASNELAWPFLDEGVNSWAEQRSLAAMFGPGSAVDLPGLTLDVAALQRVLALGAGHHDVVAQPAPRFASGSDYGALVYARTATILATLGRVYGEDELARAIGDYARKWRFGHPDADDFVAAIEERLGASAARNLRVALFDRGWVDYQAADATSRARTVDGAPRWEGWALVRREGTLAFPVTIELHGRGGEVRTTTWDGVGSWIRVPWESSSELARAVVDPGAAVLLDEDLANGAVAAVPVRRPWRTLERATFLAGLGLAAVVP